MKNFMILILLLNMGTSFAHSRQKYRQKSQKKCCVCQTGLSPSNEIQWFRKGCKFWLAKQKNCTSRDIAPIAKNDLINTALKCEGGEIKLGYVGHWGNSSELIEYLSAGLVPTTKVYNVDIDYDQTACTSMNNPKLITDFFEFLNLDNKITVKGNQVTSTGMWDDILPHRTNFWAKIDSESKTLEFPVCHKFENKVCFGKYQKNETAFCRDESGLKQLKCTRLSKVLYKWKAN